MTDSLLEWRKEFPSLEGCVHLISHSLGAMPRRAADALAEFGRLWTERSITAWDVWLPEVDAAAARIARLLGAPAGTVIMNQNVSTIESVLASCFDYAAPRNKVVYDEHNFPSVSYVWKAEERRGARVVVVPAERPDDVCVAAERLCAAIDEETLVVPISHVLFKTACIQDVKRIVARAHAVGALVILDTYQSTGTLPVDVVDLDVDFACGGSVKWLCGGPGAAYLYVRSDLVPRFAPRVTGWFGHEHPFAFTMPEQRYAPNVWRYAGGTPAIAALYQARAGAEIVAEVGVARIREKSVRLTQRIIDAIDGRGFRLRSPRAAEERGGSVVFDFDGSDAVARELNRRKFFCDHRPGVGIRISPHFYTREDEIDGFFQEIAAIGRRR
ncbi:MAG TPA: aminotransferase class V-fold PLP-dependent enzyme [Haliangiales bacterium]|nr:aminotransferase class V-fold PLP-dependent enzyme [Haliangiales bacterium]